MSHDSLPDAIDHQNKPWHLTPEDVQEFKRLIKEATGGELTDQEALNRATELVALYRMFLGPIPEDPEANHLSSPGVRPEPGA